MRQSYTLSLSLKASGTSLSSELSAGLVCSAAPNCATAAGAGKQTVRFVILQVIF